MPESVDYYRVLGIKPTATVAQIKTAYRQAAKRAHPDAGGSPTAMQLVNEANSVLSDPLARRDYDLERTRPSAPPPTHAPGREDTAPPSSPNTAEPLAERARREHQYRQALAAARRLTWPMLRFNAVMAILLAFAVPYLTAHTTSPMFKILLALVAFAPIYGLVVALIFLFRPRLRVALGTIGHRRGIPLHPSDRTALIAIALSVIPLAGLWLILFSHGLLR